MRIGDKISGNRSLVRAARFLWPHMQIALWPLEAATFLTTQSTLARPGHGDGHPVLVIPGFGTGDSTTQPLRWALKRHGYTALPWGLGSNFGPTRKIARELRLLLSEIHREHGRNVTLIGWSLGGLLARTLAREYPDIVRQVITLGSPYRMMDNDEALSFPGSIAQLVFNRLREGHDHSFEILRVPEQDRVPLIVPATSIYSRTDNIADWRRCIDATGPDAPNPRAENIEVRTSHLGLASNITVFAAILDRLMQPEGGWRPFQAPGSLRKMFPAPTGWTTDLEPPPS